VVERRHAHGADAPRAFLVARKEMYDLVLIEHNGDKRTSQFVIKKCNKPSSTKAFCGLEIDPESKRVVLSVLGCVYAVQLGCPFLAYMTEGMLNGVPVSIS
jgi:hypothetical protein